MEIEPVKIEVGKTYKFIVRANLFSAIDCKSYVDFYVYSENGKSSTDEIRRYLQNENILDTSKKDLIFTAKIKFIQTNITTIYKTKNIYIYVYNDSIKILNS
jgi:predicted RNA binding protein with dsRBD fold (UPF0201 family)